jgi:hypothetical protein
MSVPPNLQPLSPWLEDAWLERYLNRATNNEETAWFEAYMLEHPHVADALETDAAITAALSQQPPHSVQVRVALNRSAEDQPSKGAASSARGMWSIWTSALAAAALTLAISSPWLLRSTNDPTAVQPNRLMFDPARSAAADAFTVLDDVGSAWTLLEIPTVTARGRHAIYIDAKRIGVYSSDGEGVLSVLLALTPEKLKASEITTVKLDDQSTQAVDLTRTQSLDTGAKHSRVCRASNELTASSDPLDFATVGGPYADYIDIVDVSPDVTPGNACASSRQGWSAANYIYICPVGSGASLQLYAHLRTDFSQDLVCENGRPVTLDGANDQYTSAYWDDYDLGFRYYIFLEWGTSRCPQTGCKPYLIESFDLDRLAEKACFAHQAIVDRPSAAACDQRLLAKQTDTGNGHRPPNTP